MAFDLKEWVRQVFDGPSQPDAQRLGELDDFCERDAATLSRLAEVFENAPTLLAPYPEESVDQAFFDLGFSGLFAITDESIDAAVRERLIRSCVVLFRDFFAPRCQPVLGHLSENGSPLNLSCYMWWDFDCWDRSDLTCLESIQSILAINHVACQEAALHGLGHWHQAHPHTVENIIDKLLQREPDLRPELRKYAMKARAGRVL